MNNWILLKEKLPELDTQVLTWMMLGHQWQPEIATLRNHDGKNGFMEFVNNMGHITKSPNKPFPKNLEWNVSGHWVDFENVSHWTTLPKDPYEKD